MTDLQPLHRPIRSYVLREGRLTNAQRRAFEGPWQRFGVQSSAHPLELASLFRNRNPVLLEIGFGNGEALLEMSSQHPELNYLGIEVHRPGIGHLLLRLEETDRANVRVLCQDAMQALKRLAPASLAGVYLFFPDPWPKKRHHKRRIVQPAFAIQLATLIRPGGILHMASDWEDYARQMLQILGTTPGFENRLGPGRFSPRPADRPLTRFEQRGQRLGHACWDLMFIRCLPS